MGASGRPWAEALLAAAGGVGAADRVGLALDRASRAIRGEGAVRAFLEDPAGGKGPKAETLASFYGEAPRDDPGRAVFGRFASLLAAKGRIRLLPSIAAAYGGARDRAEGLLRVELRSARPLPPATARRLVDALVESEGGRSAVTLESLDPALIGGFTLRAGSIRYDRSIASRLERLRKHLARPLAAGEGTTGTNEAGHGPTGS